MIIFLPIKLAPTGGTSTFARKLQKGLAQLGHTVTFERPPQYDLLLASPQAPLRHLIAAKKQHKPVIQRLDGVYYPTTVARWQYPLHNARPAMIRHLFADATIYQSNYSHHLCNRFLGPSSTPAVTIYNGVDINHFSPHGLGITLRDSPDQKLIITASRFRRADQIIPLIAAFQAYQKSYQPNSKLVVIGNFTGTVQSIPAQYANNPSLQFLGIVPNENLPNYLRAADAFLFTHLNPPCPNNVIEAIACGVPVCGIADGAMPEIITSGAQGELVPVTNEGLYTPRPYNSPALASRLHQIISNRPTYSIACRARAEANFSLTQMINAYLKVFTRYI